jgi:hypothetical protein
MLALAALVRPTRAIASITCWTSSLTSRARELLRLQNVRPMKAYYQAKKNFKHTGPNISKDPDEAIPGFELIRARRARFIRDDGLLEHSHWTALRG